MIQRIISTETKQFIRDDFELDEETETALDVAPAQGLYWPRWDGQKWVEGRTQAEIDAIIAQAEQVEPTATELMQAEIIALKSRLAKVEAVPIVKATLEPVIIKDPIISK